MASCTSTDWSGIAWQSSAHLMEWVYTVRGTLLGGFGWRHLYDLMQLAPPPLPTSLWVGLEDLALFPLTCHCTSQRGGQTD